TRTYTYIYEDCAGFTAQWVFTYTVEYEPFSDPADASATVSCPSDTDVPPSPLPVVTDNCGNVLTPGVPDVSAVPGCGGSRTYTYVYTDCEGNTQDWVFTYMVDDDIDPTASSPAPVTVACAADVPAPDVRVVTDEEGNCTATPVVTHVGDVSDRNTCPEIITRTYRVTDDCGNSIEVTQVVTIGDNIDPTWVQAMPVDVTVECDAVPVVPGPF